jgi:hypothetical protein
MWISLHGKMSEFTKNCPPIQYVSCINVWRMIRLKSYSMENGLVTCITLSKHGKEARCTHYKYTSTLPACFMNIHLCVFLWDWNLDSIITDYSLLVSVLSDYVELAKCWNCTLQERTKTFLVRSTTKPQTISDCVLTSWNLSRCLCVSLST